MVKVVLLVMLMDMVMLVTNAGARDLISFNADNGRTNYDVVTFLIKRKIYSEITGTTDAGTGVNISFVGRYNP